MKRGIEESKTPYYQPGKKAKIMKSFNSLLLEVNHGIYADFQKYLIQQNLTKLELSYLGVEVDLAHLSRALQGTQIVALNFSYSGISSKSIVKLNLQGTQVSHLNLSGNSLDAESLANLHLQGTDIVYLDLGWNNICADLANLKLQGTKVITLNLENIHKLGAGDIDLSKLNLQGTQVAHLLLMGNRMDVNKITQLNLENTQVTTLNLDHNFIGSGDVEKFNLQNTSITCLSLQNNIIGAEALAKLNLRGTQVVALDLSYNDFDADVIANLHLQGTKVTYLVLRENNIGDNGVTKLILQGTDVCHLDLRDNQIGSFGATEFAKAIPNTSLFQVEINVQNDNSEDDNSKNGSDDVLVGYDVKDGSDDKLVEYDVIKSAVQTNKQELIGKPLSVIRESYYSERRVFKPAITLSRLREEGVPELQDLILSKLPGMAITTQYQNHKIPMGQLLQKLVTDEIAKTPAPKIN